MRKFVRAKKAEIRKTFLEPVEQQEKIKELLESLKIESK